MNNKLIFLKIIRKLGWLDDYMEKFSRNQRITAITKILIENPNKVVNLNVFADMFSSAKSTISEDLFIVRDTLERLKMGKIETISGAAGGVKYVCGISKEESRSFANNLCEYLRDGSRIIPGNYLYMTDIMCNPDIIHKAGVILAAAFNDVAVDYVITVETKGIPLAYEVSKMLGTALVVVRRDNKVTEGSTVSINYVSGSSKRIQNMFVSKKAIKTGSNCIFIDDFMKAGGTAYGIMNLLNEFESNLTGIGVLIDNIETPKKLIKDYVAVVEFNGIDEKNKAILAPSNLFK